MSAHRRGLRGSAGPASRALAAGLGNARRALAAGVGNVRRALAAGVGNARRAVAVGVGKGARRLGRGRAASLPGMAALAIDPGTLAGLAGQIQRGAVIVTGTNGKGTTCRLLEPVMRASGLHPVVNHDGSNQPSGLATALLAQASPLGRLPADDRAIGLFEVGEGSLPEVLPQVRPAVLVFTNVLRDHADHDLELDGLTGGREPALPALPGDTTLVLNADDPRLAFLASGLPNPRVYYGIEDDTRDRRADCTSDFPRCPRCTGELAYTRVFYAHLGHWECRQCGLARPAPQVRADKADLIGPASARLQVTAPSGTWVLDLPLPGLYNVYNALAAAAAAAACQLPGSALPAVADVAAGPFRMERVRIDGRDVHLVLARNPNGYTEVLRAVLGDGQPRHLLLGLDDGAANHGAANHGAANHRATRHRASNHRASNHGASNHGATSRGASSRGAGNQERDVSWIWDVDFESLRGLVPSAVISGNRAGDLAVRLKYARWTVPAGGAGTTEIAVQADPVLALQLALLSMPPGRPLWVVSTYAAARKMREWLRRERCVGRSWER